MHRNANNGSSFSPPSFFFFRRREKINSLCSQCACAARFYEDREGERGGGRAPFALKSLHSGSCGAPHLYLTPSLAPSLLFPPFKRLPPPRLNVLPSTLPLFSRSFLLSVSLLLLNLSHTPARVCGIKIRGSCTRATRNTSAATSSCLHHRRRRLWVMCRRDGQFESMCSRGHCDDLCSNVINE